MLSAVQSSSSLRSSRSPNNCSQVTSQQRNLFICGFIPKRWHNSSLQAIVMDLLPEYFVSCNSASWSADSPTRQLLVNADVFIFFVNEFTLADLNCLLTLQFAWQLMIPILMLRPPRTKLVICSQNSGETIQTNNGYLMRSPMARSPMSETLTYDDIDYALLQDILYQGYRISLVYDRLEHKRSMTSVAKRLNHILHPDKYDRPSTPHTSANCLAVNTYPKDKINTVRATPAHLNGKAKVTTVEKKPTLTPSASEGKDMRMSKSMVNLSSISRVPTAPVISEQEAKTNGLKRPNSGKGPKRSPVFTAGPVRQSTTDSLNHSTRSFSTSFERSMSSLDDLSNYQSTQYLVFPVKDRTQKPVLIRFPEDLIEDRKEDESVWGSDTSLEEEALIAPRISGDLDMPEEDSPVASPAPYLQDLD